MAPTTEEASRESGLQSIVDRESAHLVGLTHINDPDELMHPQSIGVTRSGLGVCTGLRSRDRCSVNESVARSAPRLLAVHRHMRLTTSTADISTRLSGHVGRADVGRLLAA